MGIKNSYFCIEKVKDEIVLKNNVPDGKYNLDISIIRVYDYFDERFHVNGIGIVKNGVLLYELSSFFEKGLYIIQNIKENHNMFQINEESSNNIISIFQVSGNENRKSKDLYQMIITEREKRFNRIKDISSSNKSNIYSIYVFCKKIYISTIAQYDDVEIIPYDSFKYLGEVDYINRFLKEKTNINWQISDSYFHDSMFSCVYYISNIKADSDEQAEEYALNRINILNSVFSTLLKSHGQFFASIIINVNDKNLKLKMYNTRYKGNLFLYRENGFSILNYYIQLLKKDSYLKVCLKLFNDAVDEENRMMKYYRYWNILEVIAEHYNLSKQYIRNWDNSYVINNKKEKIIIGDRKLDMIFELIRVFFCDKKEKDFLGDLEGIVDVKIFLSICYQRRCCCVHLGENCVNHKEYCNEKGRINCFNYNIIHKDNPDGFKDIILRKLEEVVNDVLIIEMNKEAGSAIKQDSFISKLLS